MTDTGPDPRRGPGPFFFSRQRMLTIFLVIAGFLLLNFAAMYFLQPTFTFPRPPPAAARPQALQEARGEALWSEVDGQRVEAWLLPGDAAGAAPLMIYAHGNGELIDLWADEFAPLRAAGIHVLLVEYPGYGRSGGTPSESSVTAALLAAYDRVAADPRIDARRIVGYGRSLGGGAIAQLAARRPLAALVLESTFTSLRDVVRRYFIPDVLVRNRFDTRGVLAKYHGPVLLVHGQFDEVIPVAHAQALKAASSAAELHVLPCGHNNCPPQWELVLSFLTANGVCRAHEEAKHENDIG
jgi:pimeloyl-ACP methyl ester carboxylesterase